MKNTSFNFRIVSLLLFSLILGLSSCKKEKFNTNSTGKDVLSEQDLLGLNAIDTTITLFTYPVLSDSVRTDEIASTAILGSYIDPVFGKTEASIYAQFTFVTPKNFLDDGISTDDLIVDSVILKLPIDDLYGKSDPQTFEVYQMTEDISLDSDYYSNKTVATSTTNLLVPGKESITPSLYDGSIDLFLNTSIGDEIMDQNGSSVLSVGADFVSWFKGLHIKTNTPQASGDGALLSLLMNGSDTTTLTVYYHNINDDQVPFSYEMIINSGTARFNNFNHDYSSTVVESALNDNSLGNSEFYIQSLAGVNSEIVFPYLSNLNETEGFVVRKAELILPYESNTAYSEATNLIALGYNDSGENVFIADQFIGNIDGTVNTADKNYTFVVTNFINQLVKGDIKDNRLLIAPIGASVSPNRTVFNGQESSKVQKIELKISYTIF